jgi:hypothetical protein
LHSLSKPLPNGELLAGFITRCDIITRIAVVINFVARVATGAASEAVKKLFQTTARCVNQTTQFQALSSARVAWVAGTCVIARFAGVITAVTARRTGVGATGVTSPNLETLEEFFDGELRCAAWVTRVAGTCIVARLAVAVINRFTGVATFRRKQTFQFFAERKLRGRASIVARTARVNFLARCASNNTFARVAFVNSATSCN